MIGGMSDLTIPEEDVPPHDQLCRFGQSWICDCAVIAKARAATLAEVHERVMRLPYEIVGEILIDRDDVEAIIRKMGENP